MNAPPSLPPAWLASDPLAWRMTQHGFDLDCICATVERAAVYEFDHGMTREAAERRALEDIRAINTTIKDRSHD